MSHDQVATIGDQSSTAITFPDARRSIRKRLVAVRSAVLAAVGSVLAFVPHVLHHAGILAGVVFITGTAGNLLLAAAGLVLSIPLLRRLYRRFRTWRAPAVAVVVFAAMFSLSAFVIGPAISSDGSSDAPAPTQTPSSHSGHHG